MSKYAAHRNIVTPSPHLTSQELANRWRCRRETISRMYRQWGLHPILIAGATLFPLEQVEAIERGRMVGVEGGIAGVGPGGVVLEAAPKDAKPKPPRRQPRKPKPETLAKVRAAMPEATLPRKKVKLRAKTRAEKAEALF